MAESSERVIVGRYRLDEPLGLGGTASVWRAHDLVLDRAVAVKVLARDADRNRFEREARAAAMLAHPNVVRLYDYGESDEGPFIVYELVPGGTLEERLPPGKPLPDEETARIAEGVAAGLAYAHAQGVVHRDLKPANVLFDAEDRPKIADFGIARLAGAGTLTEAGTVLGTAAYISPEQASGQTATPASDVYSFGVIVYRLLTGRLPFEADEPLELAAMHVHEEAPPIASLRPDAPGRLESVASAALAKDPAGRPPDGSALLRELGGVASTAPLARQPEPRRRRVPVLPVALAAVVLAAAGMAVALLVTSSGSSEPEVATTTFPSLTEPTTAETEEEPSAPATTEQATTEQTTREGTTRQETTEPIPTESVVPPPPTESTTLPTTTAPTTTG